MIEGSYHSSSWFSAFKSSNLSCYHYILTVSHSFQSFPWFLVQFDLPSVGCLDDRKRIVEPSGSLVASSCRFACHSVASYHIIYLYHLLFIGQRPIRKVTTDVRSLERHHMYFIQGWFLPFPSLFTASILVQR